jgi:hypothetical protein
MLLIGLKDVVLDRSPIRRRPISPRRLTFSLSLSNSRKARFIVLVLVLQEHHGVARHGCSPRGKDVQPGSTGSGKQDADLAVFHSDVETRDGCGRRANPWLAVGKAKGGPVPRAGQVTVHDLALVQRA